MKKQESNDRDDSVDDSVDDVDDVYCDCDCGCQANLGRDAFDGDLCPMCDEGCFPYRGWQ